MSSTKRLFRGKESVGWLVVLGFNATLTAKVISWQSGDTHVFPGFLTPVLTQLSFQSHRLLFLPASAELRGENTPERKFASTGSLTHNHQVMSPTRSPLSHAGGAGKEAERYYGEISEVLRAPFVGCTAELVSWRSHVPTSSDPLCSSWECPWYTSEPEPATGRTQEIHEYVLWCD